MHFLVKDGLSSISFHSSEPTSIHRSILTVACASSFCGEGNISVRPRSKRISSLAFQDAASRNPAIQDSLDHIGRVQGGILDLLESESAASAQHQTDVASCQKLIPNQEFLKDFRGWIPLLVLGIDLLVAVLFVAMLVLFQIRHFHSFVGVLWGCLRH